MRGKVNIHIYNKRLDYKFVLKRNITIIRGKSATGKTTLNNLVYKYMNEQKASGIKLSFDKGNGCIALTNDNWEYKLKTTDNSVVFIDEGFIGFKDAMHINEFLRIIKKTDNYFVIFCRDNFDKIPYSYEEVYEIETNNNKHTLKQYYNVDNNYRLKPNDKKDNFTLLITEDSKAGKQFFDKFYKNKNVNVVSSKGNSNISNVLISNIGSSIFVVVDGAAFGPYIDTVSKICDKFSNVKLCLPESFEWMILKSGIVSNKKNEYEVGKILKDTSNGIDITKYFSWEKFFEVKLKELTKNNQKQIQYSKTKLTAYYLNDKNMKKIAKVIGL